MLRRRWPREGERGAKGLCSSLVGEEGEEEEVVPSLASRFRERRLSQLRCRVERLGRGSAVEGLRGDENGEGVRGVDGAAIVEEVKSGVDLVRRRLCPPGCSSRAETTGRPSDLSMRIKGGDMLAEGFETGPVSTVSLSSSSSADPKLSGR